MKRWIGLVLVLFLVACSAKELPSTPTAQVIAEVQNTTNQTVVVEPVNVPEPTPKDPLIDLQEQQKKVYAEYNEVRVNIKSLESSLKKTTNNRKTKTELTNAYHERDSLKDQINQLEKQIQSLRLGRRSLQEKEEIQKALDKLAQDEKDIKAKVKDNQFRIDKVREAIQETASDQVKADLKTTLDELYADQKDLSERLDKVYQRIDEQQQNLKELEAVLEEEREKQSKESQQKLTLAKINEIDQLIKEKEEALNTATSQDEKDQIIAAINELAKEKGRLKEGLE